MQFLSEEVSGWKPGGRACWLEAWPWSHMLMQERIKTKQIQNTADHNSLNGRWTHCRSRSPSRDLAGFDDILWSRRMPIQTFYSSRWFKQIRFRSWVVQKIRFRFWVARFKKLRFRFWAVQTVTLQILGGRFKQIRFIFWVANPLKYKVRYFVLFLFEEVSGWKPRGRACWLEDWPWSHMLMQAWSKTKKLDIQNTADHNS